MFLLSRLCEYFAMNTSFRVTLLYLLLIIPQHGNSPLPVMESWLQKDQDDGFAQRDMTSSLTGGDESFGSAHQTYQNSLIRKKKADNLANSPPGADFGSFTPKLDRNQIYTQPNVFVDETLHNEQLPLDVLKRNNLYESAVLPYSPYLTRTPNYLRPIEDSSDSIFMNVLGEDPNLLSTKMRILNNRLNLHAEAERNLNAPDDDLGRNAKWAFCKSLKSRFTRNPFIGAAQPPNDRNSLNFYENSLLQNDYLPLEDERAGFELKSQEYKDVNRPEGKNPQISDENEYYEAEANPMIEEEDVSLGNDDYNQMLNEHIYMNKRDEKKQAKNTQKIRNTEAARVVFDALKSPEFGRTFLSDSPLMAMADDGAHAQKSNAKTREIDNANMNNMPDSDLIWKLTSDFQNQELNNVMRNSQKALQEVQQFQQKLSYKSGEGNENDGLKRQSGSDPFIRFEKKKMNFDEKRLKREDEDEQKNMKTGTDEGGGGEYEDEEGKGHKDEEEYYEDADLSNDESGTEVQGNDELNQKYVKREATEDKKQSSVKNELNEGKPQDYELNLENAPVENAERSRKTSYREGEKSQKNSVRKGVKIWDEWGKWSPCSVTCGVGRSTRWRHCIGGGCAQGEKEAQIKRCTNPAC